MEELKVMENVDVTEVMETCTEVIKSSNGNVAKIVAGVIGGGIAIGVTVGAVVSKRKKNVDKPKKLSWIDKQRIKRLEKKGVKVEVPDTETESDSEPVEETE